jgi:hypothetical protein
MAQQYSLLGRQSALITLKNRVKPTHLKKHCEVKKTVITTILDRAVHEVPLLCRSVYGRIPRYNLKFVC